MVRFLVEHGACIFATTLSDHETAAEKCEEDEEGFDGCSEYLYHIQVLIVGIRYNIIFRYNSFPCWQMSKTHRQAILSKYFIQKF